MLQTVVMAADMRYKYSVVERTWLVAMYYALAVNFKTILTKFAARFPQTPVLQCESVYKLKFEPINC